MLVFRIMDYLVICAALVTSTVASAQPGTSEEPPRAPEPAAPGPRVDRAFVAGGVLVGADVFMHAALSAEGGMKLGPLPVWVQGAIASGSAFDFEGGGALQRALLGMEVRTCGSEAVCVVGGLAAGFQTSVWSSGDESDPEEHHHGPVIAGRFGIDTGGERIRFRGALEVERVRDESNVTSRDWHTGFGLTLGLGYRL